MTKKCALLLLLVASSTRTLGTARIHDSATSSRSSHYIRISKAKAYHHQQQVQKQQDSSSSLTFTATFPQQPPLSLSVSSEPAPVTSSSSSSLDQRLEGWLSQPLIPTKIWESLNGQELLNAASDGGNIHPWMDALAQAGATLACQDDDTKWVHWKQQQKQSSTSDNNDDAIQVWTGKAPLDCNEYMGCQLPIIKTRSILNMSAKDMVDLLLDSSRVKTYNPWSLGRVDCWTNENDNKSSSPRNTITKIVKNKTQPPLGKKQMVGVTLMHARPWPTPNENNDNDTKAWLVVSRAVGGNHFIDNSNQDNLIRSDMLLGVNFLECLDNDKCRLTAVTHVYCTAIPTMLAERLGVKSAIQFVKDMRSLAE